MAVVGLVSLYGLRPCCELAFGWLSAMPNLAWPKASQVLQKVCPRPNTGLALRRAAGAGAGRRVGRAGRAGVPVLSGQRRRAAGGRAPARARAARLAHAPVRWCPRACAGAWSHRICKYLCMLHTLRMPWCAAPAFRWPCRVVRLARIFSRCLSLFSSGEVAAHFHVPMQA